MKIALLVVAGTLCVMLLIRWAMSGLHYRIGSRYLKVMLFGVPLRRLLLTDIKRVSKRRPKGWSEHWHSTFKTTHRLVTIERSAGLRKYFCITPRNRYVFIADLKNAVRRVNPTVDVLDDPTEPSSELDDIKDVPAKEEIPS